MKGDPDAFATSAEIVDFLTAYAAFIAAPVRCGVTVTALHVSRRAVSGFLCRDLGRRRSGPPTCGRDGPYQRPTSRCGCQTRRLSGARERLPRSRTSFRPERSSLSAPAPPAPRSPRSSLARAARSVCPSAATADAAPVPRTGSSGGLAPWVSIGRPWKARARQVPAPDHWRLWGTHHRFSRIRVAGNDASRPGEGVARRILDLAPDLADSLAFGDAAYSRFPGTSPMRTWRAMALIVRKNRTHAGVYPRSALSCATDPPA